MQRQAISLRSYVVIDCRVKLGMNVTIEDKSRTHTHTHTHLLKCNLSMQTRLVVIVNKCAHYFADSSSANNVTRASELYDEFTRIRGHHCGAPFKGEFLFDVELLSNVIDTLKRGKAAGLDNLSAEHLIHCHPILNSTASFHEENN